MTSKQQHAHAEAIRIARRKAARRKAVRIGSVLVHAEEYNPATKITRPLKVGT